MRDLSYTPKTAAQLDELATVTPDDVVHAQQTAATLATPKMKKLLAATAEPTNKKTKQRRSTE